MYKIDRRGGGGPKNCSLGNPQGLFLNSGSIIKYSLFLIKQFFSPGVDQLQKQQEAFGPSEGFRQTLQHGSRTGNDNFSHKQH